MGRKRKERIADVCPEAAPLLKRRLGEMGATSRNLAEALGVTRRTAQSYIKDPGGIPTEYLQTIESVYRYPVQQLVYGDGKGSPMAGMLDVNTRAPEEPRLEFQPCSLPPGAVGLLWAYCSMDENGRKEILEVSKAAFDARKRFRDEDAGFQPVLTVLDALKQAGISAYDLKALSDGKPLMPWAEGRREHVALSLPKLDGTMLDAFEYYAITGESASFQLDESTLTHKVSTPYERAEDEYNARLVDLLKASRKPATPRGAAPSEAPAPATEAFLEAKRKLDSTPYFSD